MLTEEALREASAILAARDPDLARVMETLGPPPLWAREPGFATLVYIILEQQVSLASARAAYNRLAAAIAPISPQNLLTLSDEELKAIGFSRQKMGYARILARAILDGQIDLESLAAMEDDAVRAALTRIKGIGRWTADIYLMEALLRPDVWPAGDLALAIAVRRVKNLESLPSPSALNEMGERYRPWRAAAARLFWHHYLNTPLQHNPK